jgi:hypothetical protein
MREAVWAARQPANNQLIEVVDLVIRIKPRLDEVITAGRRGAWRAQTEEHEQHQCRAPWPSHSPEPSRFHQALPLSS